MHTALHNPRPRYRSITAATAGIYYLVQAAVSLLLESNSEYWRCRASLTLISSTQSHFAKLVYGTHEIVEFH